MHQHLPTIRPLHNPPGVADAPGRHESAEDMAWAHLYRAVRQPPAAAEVVKYVTTHPEALNRLEPLYLIACETLHARARVDEHNERMLAFFRAVFVTVPVRALKLATSVVLGIVRPAGHSAVEPRARRTRQRLSRAKARVDALAKHPEVAQAIAGFDASPKTSSAAPEPAAAGQAQGSRRSQAA